MKPSLIFIHIVYCVSRVKLAKKNIMKVLALLADEKRELVCSVNGSIVYRVVELDTHGKMKRIKIDSRVF